MLRASLRNRSRPRRSCPFRRHPTSIRRLRSKPGFLPIPRKPSSSAPEKTPVQGSARRRKSRTRLTKAFRAAGGSWPPVRTMRQSRFPGSRTARLQLERRTPQKKQLSPAVLAGAAVALLAVGGGGAFLLSGGDSPPDAVVAEAPADTSAATTAALGTGEVPADANAVGNEVQDVAAAGGKPAGRRRRR